MLLSQGEKGSDATISIGRTLLIKGFAVQAVCAVHKLDDVVFKDPAAVKRDNIFVWVSRLGL